LTMGADLTGFEGVKPSSIRTLSVRRHTENALFFESSDLGYGGAWIHRSYLPRKE
jgi:hypothetical protein